MKNRYFQYFCGKVVFRHELPFGRSSLTRWRQRLGEEQIAALLQKSLSVARRTGATRKYLNAARLQKPRFAPTSTTCLGAKPNCRSSNFQGIMGNCVRMCLGGNSAIANRMEISGRGVVGGVSPQGQRVLATADNGSGGTRLTVASTIAFVPWDQIIITDYWGIGSNILGTWPKLTKVDATHIDITVAYQAVNWAAGAQPSGTSGLSKWNVYGRHLCTGGTISLFKVS